VAIVVSSVDVTGGDLPPRFQRLRDRLGRRAAGVAAYYAEGQSALRFSREPRRATRATERLASTDRERLGEESHMVCALTSSAHRLVKPFPALDVRVRAACGEFVVSRPTELVYGSAQMSEGEEPGPWGCSFQATAGAMQNKIDNAKLAFEAGDSLAPRRT
jgi:hypothetical protein